MPRVGRRERKTLIHLKGLAIIPTKKNNAIKFKADELLSMKTPPPRIATDSDNFSALSYVISLTDDLDTSLAAKKCRRTYQPVNWWSSVKEQYQTTVR